MRVCAAYRAPHGPGLRYVDLLLANKWFLPLDVLSDGELEGRVWVPTPAAFVFHKGLVYKKRTDQLKREKDLCYIFYVLDASRAWHRCPAVHSASPIPPREGALV